MSKMKPSKCLVRRVKVTGTGKLKHKRRGTSHLMTSFTGKRKRHLRNGTTVPANFAPKLGRAIGVKAHG